MSSGAALVGSTYPVRLGFTPEGSAIPDPEHPGLRRAGPRAAAPYGDRDVEHHRCSATDILGDEVDPPDLRTHGFDVVDLSGLATLQATCASVREAGRITDDQAAAIRSTLDGATLRTASGRELRVLHLADEGFIMRTAGPDRLPLVGPRSNGMNDHGGATSVHADQDVFGTPMAQLMDGRAPELFVHDSPDGQNHDGSLFLLNLWIPLQQITQPLVLADGRSIDRQRHQLRYGLATDSFLERDDELVINDIWTFLHDDGQRWYFRSAMDHRHAYVFNTLSTPHGAGTLPGEDVAAWCFHTLAEAESLVGQGDAGALADLLGSGSAPALPELVTPVLADAVGDMLALLDDARTHPEDVCGPRAEAWSASSAWARRQVVRMSLEMRTVVAVDR